jgi:hypothetical protein
VTELPVQRLLLEAVSILERLKIPYMIMGGFAVRVWAVPRPTYDADLAVAVDENGMLEMLDALERGGFDVPAEHRKGFRDVVAGMQKVKATRFESGAVWDVDLFVVRPGLLESALRRRRSCSLENRAVWVMAPEDVILLKLVAWRRKDQLDVEEIVKVTADLDRPYLREWAVRLNVESRLREFMAS